MDIAAANPRTPLRILFELRPALAGHAGIPQATRLLFRGLAMLEGVRIEGLLQSGETVLSRGLPSNPRSSRRLSTDQQVNLLGRVVIAMEQAVWDKNVNATGHTIVMALKHLLGGKQRLTRFDARNFQDFI